MRANPSVLHGALLLNQIAEGATCLGTNGYIRFIRYNALADWLSRYGDAQSGWNGSLCHCLQRLLYRARAMLWSFRHMHACELAAGCSDYRWDLTHEWASNAVGCYVRSLSAMADCMDESLKEQEGSTDLARAWESNSSVRRRAAVYQLALMLQIRAVNLRV